MVGVRTSLMVSHIYYPTAISINPSLISLTSVGQTKQLYAVFTPSKAYASVIWSSSDESVATVDSNGLVTCVTPGNCTITATTDNGLSATCTVGNFRLVDLLLIGGGGAGGYYCGGGGGAGGVIQCEKYNLYAGSYTVTIGAGGCGWSSSRNCSGNDGCNSSFNSLIAYGGGGGGGYMYHGCPGGSGGGGGHRNGGSSYTYGGGGCAGQGYQGGGGRCYGAGGGGGAGCLGCGASGTLYVYGGQGGIGIQTDISGTMQWYAGGGSGGSRCSTSCVTAASCGGTASFACATICGAGGGGDYSGSNHGGNGLFIMRYKSDCGYNITGGTKYECNGYCIHCFTSNGTLTVN